ncbi:hypothetical protein [Sphingobium herbicidovorans]|uniref:hypothetical protein n=1 Tax=Sphingobium herbicidovorans TaxID=76947 RepID=UPI0012E005D3|nr:hypothetical protein [Sphingobium herbicidovorans]
MQRSAASGSSNSAHSRAVDAVYRGPFVRPEAVSHAIEGAGSRRCPKFLQRLSALRRSHGSSDGQQSTADRSRKRGHGIFLSRQFQDLTIPGDIGIIGFPDALAIPDIIIRHAGNDRLETRAYLVHGPERDGIARADQCRLPWGGDRLAG